MRCRSTKSDSNCEMRVSSLICGKLRPKKRPLKKNDISIFILALWPIPVMAWRIFIYLAFFFVYFHRRPSQNCMSRQNFLPLMDVINFRAPTRKAVLITGRRLKMTWLFLWNTSSKPLILENGIAKWRSCIYE